MFNFFSNGVHPIGVDISDDGIRIAQIREGRLGLVLVGGASANLPESITAGSPDWQRWAVQTIKDLTVSGGFAGNDVIVSIPPSDVYIDYMRAQKTSSRSADEAILSKAKQKLPSDLNDPLIKYIPADEDNLLVVATERVKIDRHLAIYENAGLRVKSIGIWPEALTNSYVKFFGRRQADLETVVMLIDVGVIRTNVVICRHKNLLFARSIPTGIRFLTDQDALNQLILEISSCRQQFSSIYKKVRIERLLFISGQAVDKNICVTIAKQIQVAAQIGDCLSAVQTSNHHNSGMEKRNCQFSWATAFGLSLA
jgi:Tfp pilus assembly PilM family ATPase